MRLLIALFFLTINFSHGQDNRVTGMWEFDTSYQEVDSLFSYSVTLKSEYYFGANLDVEMRARYSITYFGQTNIGLIQIFGRWNTTNDSILMTRMREIIIEDSGGPNEQWTDDYTVETDTSIYRFLDPPHFTLMEVSDCDPVGGCDTTVITKTGNVRAFTLPDLSAVVALREFRKYRSAQYLIRKSLKSYAWKERVYGLDGRRMAVPP